MKGIEQILTEAGIDGDQADAITREVTANYRSINEVEKKAARIQELTDRVEALTAEIESAEQAGAELQEARALIERYEAEEAERKAEAEEATRRDGFKAVFDAAVGDREFANGLIRDTVFDRVYDACMATDGLGAREALDSVIDGLDNVWLNPQLDERKQPKPGSVQSGKQDAATAKRDFVRRFFGSGED